MPGAADIRINGADLARSAARCFEADGLPHDHAAIAAEALVAADRRGVKTHGVVRIPQYAKRLRAGMLNPTPDIRVETRMPFSHVVHADNAVGMVAAHVAMEACLRSADTLGVGAATVRHANHFGAAAVHTLRAARAGCIGFAMSPGATTLAPHGSRAALFGTNPFAAATPAGRYAPWSLDMASSVSSRGRIRLAARDGTAIPEGWALDAEGRPTTDPQAALSGVVLPFGGAKGSGLAMMVDILAGVLSGSGFAGETREWIADFEAPADVGHFFLVLKVEAFMALPEFEARMETAIERLKALPPANGFDEVLYPGERGGRAEADATRNGVVLEQKTADLLRAHGRDLGVDLAF